MADVSYSCDAHGLITGQVSNGSRVIEFSVPSNMIMTGKDRGIHVLDEVISAALMELDNNPYDDAPMLIKIEAMPVAEVIH